MFRVLSRLWPNEEVVSSTERFAWRAIVSPNARAVALAPKALETPPWSVNPSESDSYDSRPEAPTPASQTRELGRRIFAFLVGFTLKAYGVAAAASVAVSDAETVGGKCYDAVRAVPT